LGFLKEGNAFPLLWRRSKKIIVGAGPPNGSEPSS